MCTKRLQVFRKSVVAENLIFLDARLVPKLDHTINPLLYAPDGRQRFFHSHPRCRSARSLGCLTRQVPAICARSEHSGRLFPLLPPPPSPLPPPDTDGNFRRVGFTPRSKIMYTVRSFSLNPTSSDMIYHEYYWSWWSVGTRIATCSL